MFAYFIECSYFLSASTTDTCIKPTRYMPTQHICLWNEFPLCCNSFYTLRPFATHSLLLFLILLLSSFASMQLCRSFICFLCSFKRSFTAQVTEFRPYVAYNRLYVHKYMYKSLSLNAVFYKNYNLIIACRTVSNIICYVEFIGISTV